MRYSCLKSVALLMLMTRCANEIFDGAKLRDWNTESRDVDMPELSASRVEENVFSGS